MITERIIVTGRVQGVGFRYFTKNLAKSLGLKGYVRNLYDGNVEIVIQTDNLELLEIFLEKIKLGNSMARVLNLNREQIDEKARYSYFSIEF